MTTVERRGRTWSVLVDGKIVSHNIRTEDRAKEIASNLEVIDEAGQRVTETLTSVVEARVEEGEFQPVFSKVGLGLIKDLKKVFPHPVLLIGDTGWGKSVLVREVAKQLDLSFNSLNAHPGMDMGMVVGMWRPYPNGTGISLKWQDGLLTDSIRNGKAFLFEELTRSPQDAISRLYGILDNGFRSWSCPESGEEVEVHKKFWFLATANPSGQGYYTQKLDKAMHSRFAAVFAINEPIADENTIVQRICPDKVEVVMKIVHDWRKSFQVPTRDLVLFSELIAKGFDMSRAAELAVVSKETKDQKGMIEVVKWHS